MKPLSTTRSSYLRATSWTTRELRISPWCSIPYGLYRLLLGIDEEKKEIVCGLVDTIGSYTFAKTLEYKAKQGLQSGKDVTVMPPTEYQDRFVNALESYFVACPGKFFSSV